MKTKPITSLREIPNVFRDQLPSGATSQKNVNFAERGLLRFKNEVPVDHMGIVGSFEDSVSASVPDAPEGFKVRLTSNANVAMPSTGQLVAIREKSGVMRPLFLQLPTPGQLHDVQNGLSSITKHKDFFIYTRIPHPRVAGQMVPKLRYNQEYVILNIYVSPYGVSYQVHSMDGIPEPITQSVELYGTRDWQRNFLSKFIGKEIQNTDNISMKTQQYKALPLGVFVELYKLTYREVQHAADKLPKEVRWSMNQLFSSACRLGGHDPYASTRDEAYVPNAELEVTVEDFFTKLDRDPQYSQRVQAPVRHCADNGQFAVKPEPFQQPAAATSGAYDAMEAREQELIDGLPFQPADPSEPVVNVVDEDVPYIEQQEQYSDAMALREQELIAAGV